MENFNIDKFPRSIDAGLWKTGHLQGIAVDTAHEYIYYAFTTVLVKARLNGETVGWVGGLAGHLGCIDFNDEDGRVYASLELNNFVTTVGRKYMSEENIKKINDKAEKYEIEVDLSPEGIEPSRRRQPLEEALVALEESTDIMRKPGFNSDDMVTLRRLPLWDNFQRWQNLLLVGLI